MKSNKNIFPIIVIAVFLIIHFFIINNVSLVAGDDLNFKRMVENYAFFDFITERYQGWTGRIVIESFLYVLIKDGSGFFIWKLLSLALYCIYILSVTSVIKTLINEKIKIAYQCVIVFLVACWPYLLLYSTFNQGVTWFTGSFNYFFPFVFACVVLLFIVKKNP